MDVAAAARTLNAVGYGYIGSWALLTACQERVFDRLPATTADLADTYPDADLVSTWFRVLEHEGVVREVDGVWDLPEAMEVLLVGDHTYADYLGGQVLQQMAPRLTLGSASTNVLADALRRPAERTGYAGWFTDAAEAEAYQRSQFAGSVGPARALSKLIPVPDGTVFDLGGGWGAMARAIAERHEIEVDVVDLDAVVSAAPPAHERVDFRAGNALDRATWPTGRDYDGAVLSYLLSSVPGDAHEPLFDALADTGVRWVAVHDFFLDAGAYSPAWCLQHAVFVPGHRSRTTGELSELLADRGWGDVAVHPVVDEMTAVVVATRR